MYTLYIISYITIKASLIIAAYNLLQNYYASIYTKILACKFTYVIKYIYMYLICSLIRIPSYLCVRALLECSCVHIYTW